MQSDQEILDRLVSRVGGLKAVIRDNYQKKSFSSSFLDGMTFALELVEGSIYEDQKS